jgi:hypothetical protein
VLGGPRAQCLVLVQQGASAPRASQHLGGGGRLLAGGTRPSGGGLGGHPGHVDGPGEVGDLHGDEVRHGGGLLGGGGQQRTGGLVLEACGADEPRHRVLHAVPGVGEPALHLAALVLQPLLHPLVDLGAEDALQQAAPLLGVGTQEAGELALRQHHGLHELRPVQPDHPGQLGTRLVQAGGDDVAHRLVRGAVRHGTEPPELHGGLLARAAAAPALDPVVRRGATHPVDAGAGLEDQVDDGLDVLGGEGGAQPVLAGPGAGDLAVEREDDRVDDRGLAGAGGALQQEQPAGGELGEVDLVPAGEGSDGLDGERVQPHQALRSAATTCS